MNMPRKGFTVVELLVVIVVIGILITMVSFHALRGQTTARDRERENDVKIIATLLEEIYKSGQADGVMVPTGDAAITTATPMGYPSTAVLTSPTQAQSLAIIGAIDPNALKSPIRKTMSFVAAPTAAGIVGNSAGGRAIGATSANDVYVYQPLNSANTRCVNANSLKATQLVIAPRLINTCIRFIIYYYSETSSSIKSLPSVNSNNNGL